MTNDKFQMTKELRNPNDEGSARARAATIRTFGLRHSFDIPHSEFVIGPILRTSAATIL